MGICEKKPAPYLSAFGRSSFPHTLPSPRWNEKDHQEPRLGHALESQQCTQSFRVSDGLYRGGQPPREGFLGLKQLGVRTIVNLREVHSDRPMVEGTGLRYYRVPVSAARPRRADLRRFLALARNSELQPVFVHCMHGSDRTGIPIMPQFSDKHSPAECAAQFGVAPDVRTILMMPGGVSIAGIEKLATELLRLDDGFQLIALAGRNVGLLEELKKVAARLPKRLLPLGFTTEVDSVVAASDLAVSKPGGLTTSECLAMGPPMIVVSPIPGQEERNADFLLENGAALKACDASGLTWRVNRVLKEPGLLERLGRQAALVGRPHAARVVLDRVFGSE
jgi:protein tyrosine phosphatase (PTP) superfamily phosphohydrolase (DUF442 family)